MVKSPKDSVNGNWRPCVLLMGTGGFNDDGQCSKRANEFNISNVTMRIHGFEKRLGLAKGYEGKAGLSVGMWVSLPLEGDTSEVVETYKKKKKKKKKKK
ncbi:hypothetical protein V1478_000654 [Vespula squamosa]|uniref:Uncharacterized protein n=1 Tax=Vespula squamosa TaxID=30214 RepID=A0ABD2C649_VESSQ